jgi:hypothetical protein
MERFLINLIPSLLERISSEATNTKESKDALLTLKKYF